MAQKNVAQLFLLKALRIVFYGKEFQVEWYDI